jgi:hypothetical protein
VAAAGIYPGFQPFRMKLIEAEESPDDESLWDRAISLGEASAAALRQRLSQATAGLVAPREIYSLFRPSAMLSRGEGLYLLDSDQKAIPLGGDGRAAVYGFQDALARGPVGAVLCRVRFTEQAMAAEPLSLIARGGGIGARLVRLTA